MEARRATSRPASRRRPAPADQRAVALVSAALLAAPLLIGGAPTFAVAAVFPLCVGALALTARAARRAGAPLDVGLPGLVLLAAVAWEALHLVPLPPALHRLVSPGSAEIQAASLAALGAWPAWRPLSLDPIQTGLEVTRHLGWVALFVAVSNLARATGTRRLLTRALAVTAVAVSALALVQALLGLEHIYGLWPTPPGGLAFAAFVNPNHLGAFLDLTAPVLLALAIAAPDRPRTALWGLAFALAVAVAGLSLSRGGIAALGVGLAAFGALAGRAAAGRRTPWRAILLLGAALAVAAWLGLDPVLEELSTLTGEGIAAEARWEIWRQVLDLLSTFWFVGVGAGAFAVAFPVFRTEPGVVTFTHAESQPLHVAAESGVWIAAVLLVVAGVWWVRAARRRDLSRTGLALLAGLAALGVHELADFATALGGVAVPAVVAAGLLAAEVGPLRPRRLRLTPGALGVRLVPTFLIAAVVLGGLGLARGWGRRANEELPALAARLEAGAPVDAAVADVAARHPADHMPHLLAARVLLDRGDPGRALPYAARAMRLDPADPRAHLMAAEALARGGRPGQALVEWRLAARWGHPATEVVRLAAAHLTEPEQVVAAVPDTPRDRLAAAAWLRRQGLHGLARTELARQAERAPDDPHVLKAWFSAALADDRPDEAERAAEALEAAEPDTGEGAVLRARAQAAGGDPAAARETLRAVLARRPGHAGAALALAQMELSEGTPEAALEVLERVRGASRHQRAAAWRLRARARTALGETSDAVAAWRTVARLAPRDADPWRALGDLWMGAGQPGQALDAYEAALARAGEPPPDWLVARRDRAEEARAKLEAERRRRDALGVPPVRR